MNINEANEVVKMFGDRGVISVSFDEGDCRAKIAELGLPVPEGKNNGLLYSRAGEVAYLFICAHDEDNANGRPLFVGCTFDFAKYRSNPLEGVGAREAFVLFMQAVADLAGFDLEDATLEVDGNFEN